MTGPIARRPRAEHGASGPGGRRGVALLVAGVLLVASTLVACAAGRSGEAAAGEEPPRDSTPAGADSTVFEVEPTPFVVPGDPAPRSPGELLTAAVAAADSARPGAAILLLEEVRERCGRSSAGARATIVLAALHLDARHPDGDPQSAAELAAGYLRAGVGPAWTGPVARVLYLEALEKGARPPDPAGLGPDHDARAPGDAQPPPGCRDPDVSAPLDPSRILPDLPGTPMADRLRRLRARVAELEKELERIRDILDEP